MWQHLEYEKVMEDEKRKVLNERMSVFVREVLHPHMKKISEELGVDPIWIIMATTKDGGRNVVPGVSSNLHPDEVVGLLMRSTPEYCKKFMDEGLLDKGVQVITTEELVQMMVGEDKIN